jgi:hypothetical protein
MDGVHTWTRPPPRRFFPATVRARAGHSGVMTEPPVGDTLPWRGSAGLIGHHHNSTRRRRVQPFVGRAHRRREWWRRRYPPVAMDPLLTMRLERV